VTPSDIETLSTVEQVRLAVEAAESRKAEQLRVLELRERADFTDFFLIMSGTNQRQVQAIVDAIVERLRGRGVRPLHVEGYRLGRWVLIDYGGDLVIHVFQPETRDFYGLERLWSDAPDRTAGFASAAAPEPLG